MCMLLAAPLARKYYYSLPINPANHPNCKCLTANGSANLEVEPNKSNGSRSAPRIAQPAKKKMGFVVRWCQRWKKRYSMSEFMCVFMLCLFERQQQQQQEQQLQSQSSSPISHHHIPNITSLVHSSLEAPRVVSTACPELTFVSWRDEFYHGF